MEMSDGTSLDTLLRLRSRADASFGGLSLKTPAGCRDRDVRFGRVNTQARTVEPVIDRRGSAAEHGVGPGSIRRRACPIVFACGNRAHEDAEISVGS